MEKIRDWRKLTYLTPIRILLCMLIRYRIQDTLQETVNGNIVKILYWLPAVTILLPNYLKCAYTMWRTDMPPTLGLISNCVNTWLKMHQEIKDWIEIIFFVFWNNKHASEKFQVFNFEIFFNLNIEIFNIFKITAWIELSTYKLTNPTGLVRNYP